MIFPTLYKATKTGATQQFNIGTGGSIITVAFRQVGGKQQTQETLCNGKQRKPEGFVPPETRLQAILDERI